MEQINEAKRKPRRTKGTPSYYYRNRFAAATIFAGSAIFALWCMTPIFRKANEKILHDLTTITEEEKDRKYLFNLLAAPKTSKGIQQTIDDVNKAMSER